MLEVALQRAAARGRQPVTAAAAFTGLFQPAPGDKAPVFQAEQNRVQRADTETDLALGALLDQLADVVSMARPPFQQSEHQQLRTTLAQVTIEHTSSNYTSETHMRAERNGFRKALVIRLQFYKPALGLTGISPPLERISDRI